MWVLNNWLFMLFSFLGQARYQQAVQAGSPCFAAIPDPITGAMPTTPAPACWYDPSNTN